MHSTEFLMQQTIQHCYATKTLILQRNKQVSYFSKVVAKVKYSINDATSDLV